MRSPPQSARGLSPTASCESIFSACVERSCNMVFVKGRGVMMTALGVLALVALVSSQITFSRDWSGGKRAAPLALDCEQFAHLCRHFLHEMKSGKATIPQTPSKRRRVGDDSLFIDDYE